jgi:hypothetical protein
MPAGVRRNGEAGRHGEAEIRHLGEVGPLAPEQVLQVLVPSAKSYTNFSTASSRNSAALNRLQARRIHRSASSNSQSRLLMEAGNGLKSLIGQP